MHEQNRCLVAHNQQIFGDKNIDCTHSLLVIIIPANIQIGIRQMRYKIWDAANRRSKKEKKVKTELARTLSLNHLLLRNKAWFGRQKEKKKQSC